MYPSRPPIATIPSPAAPSTAVHVQQSIRAVVAPRSLMAAAARVRLFFCIGRRLLLLSRILLRLRPLRNEARAHLPLVHVLNPHLGVGAECLLLCCDRTRLLLLDRGHDVQDVRVGVGNGIRHGSGVLNTLLGREDHQAGLVLLQPVHVQLQGLVALVATAVVDSNAEAGGVALRDLGQL